MTRRTLAILSLLGLMVLPAAQCDVERPVREASRVPNTEPGSCDGFVDYGDEFDASNFRFDWMGPVGVGLVEAHIRFDLHNAGRAPFRAATATPDFSAAADLGVLPGALPAEFGPLDPGASASSVAPMVLQLPAASMTSLMARLGNGEIPFVVHADEINVLAPGVEIHDWTAFEDRMYYLASQPSGGFGTPVNLDPGPGPFAPGQEFDVGFLEFNDDATSVFDDFDAGDMFYLVENPDGPLSGGGPLVNIPDAFDKVRVVDAQRIDEDDDGFTFWLVKLKRTDTEPLPQIYSTASFCTGTAAHVDPAVQKTRLNALDGDVVEDEARDGNEQPLRINKLTFTRGPVTLSGQIAGHVLKPSLALRLRDGHVETGVDFDTDISFAAELRAEDDADFEEEQELWKHCFPLPELPAGPVSIPMNLQLVHTVGLEAGVAAGAVVGFEKHFESGFGITCHTGGGIAQACESTGRRNPTPIQFTPPQLTDKTGANMRAETTLSALLRIGSPYPVCDSGPGVSLDTTAYGEMNVAPALDPWWSSAYGLDVKAAVDLDILGLDVTRFDTDVFSTKDGASSADAVPATTDAAPGARSSGEDQRWAVAIDDTTVPNGVSTTAIAALPDGSSVAIATEAIGGRTPVVKLDRFGAMQWVKEFGAGKAPQRIRALSDGSFVVVGTNAWLARLDGDGNLLFSFDAEIARSDLATARCVLRDVAPIERSPGVYDYVAVGRMGASIVTQYDACAFRVNADGSMPWARVYIGDRVQEFRAATPTRDGNVAIAGTDSWSFVGNRSIPLFAKLDAATGDVIWWKGLPMTRIAVLSGITEAPDGTLFGVGNSQGIIYSTGASIVARIDADGSDARHAFVFQDEDWEALLDFETWTDTAGGDTPYDTYFDIAPSGDGFVIAGNTGLGAATAARVAKINSKLGVEWITTWDGAAVDSLGGVAPTSDGIFVSGYSGSLPQADGGVDAENQLWVMKLPFTGTLEFLPEVSMTTRFIEPGVRFSSTDPGVNPLDEPAIDDPFSVVDAVVNSFGPNPALVVPASPYCVELLTPTGHPTTTDACPD